METASLALFFKQNHANQDLSYSYDNYHVSFEVVLEHLTQQLHLHFTFLFKFDLAKEMNVNESVFEELKDAIFSLDRAELCPPSSRHYAWLDCKESGIDFHISL